MTAKELIDHLSHLDPDQDVWLALPGHRTHLRLGFVTEGPAEVDSGAFFEVYEKGYVPSDAREELGF